MFPRGASAYRKSQVTTASPAQLVVQLYQGAICFLERAIQAMEEGDLEQSHCALIRVQDIVTQLRSTLNRDVGPLALQLDSLYDYFWRQLVLANVCKEPAIAREVLDHLRQLLETWQTVAELSSRTAEVAAAPILAGAQR
jgi:flagellar protein FliS